MRLLHSLILLGMCLSSAARAEVSVTIAPLEYALQAGEPCVAIVTITNRGARAVTLPPLDPKFGNVSVHVRRPNEEHLIRFAPERTTCALSARNEVLGAGQSVTHFIYFYGSPQYGPAFDREGVYSLEVRVAISDSQSLRATCIGPTVRGQIPAANIARAFSPTDINERRILGRAYRAYESNGRIVEYRSARTDYEAYVRTHPNSRLSYYLRLLLSPENSLVERSAIAADANAPAGARWLAGGPSPVMSNPQ